MPYKYVAYNNDKKLVTGTIDVTSEGMAEQAIQRAGYRLLSLESVGTRVTLQRLMPSLFGIKTGDVIFFSRQMATLIETGTTIPTALQLLQEQVSNTALKVIVGTIIEDVRSGSSFSEALERHPDAFPQIYRRMVGVGEQTGNLEVVLRQAANYMEKEKLLVKKVSRAMIYPVIILLLALGVVTLMLTFALPSMVDMFDEFNADLPVTTRLLIAITNGFATYKLHLLAVVLAIAGAAVWGVKQPVGRRSLDKVLLKMPLIGPVCLLREISHICRTMSMLVHAALPMPEIMDITVQTTGNTAVAESVEDVRTKMLQGQGLSQPMSQHQVFPRLLVQTVAVGEETGTLDSNLATLADSYEGEVDERVNKLVSMMEPCLMLGMGVVVGFIVISVIMPMYSIMGKVE
jgi:type IV pilus assembly protein PilC